MIETLEYPLLEIDKNVSNYPDEVFHLNPTTSSVTVVDFSQPTSYVKTDMPRKPLSPRLNEVLKLVAQGRADKQITRKLGFKMCTADKHRENLYKKLGVNTAAGAALIGIADGIINPHDALKEVNKNGFDQLSGAEIAVLKSFLETRGGTNKQIADNLGISGGTVRKHFGRIFAKVETNSRVQLASAAAALSYPIFFSLR